MNMDPVFKLLQRRHPDSSREIGLLQKYMANQNSQMQLLKKIILQTTGCKPKELSAIFNELSIGNKKMK
jgi:hypothetical protein